jgi:hypothetical protein
VHLVDQDHAPQILGVFSLRLLEPQLHFELLLGELLQLSFALKWIYFLGRRHFFAENVAHPGTNFAFGGGVELRCLISIGVIVF